MSIVKRFAATYAVVWAIITGALAKESTHSVLNPTDEDVALGTILTTVPMVAYELVVPAARDVPQGLNTVVEVAGATVLTTATGFAIGCTNDCPKDDRVLVTKTFFVCGLVVTTMYAIVRRFGR